VGFDRQRQLAATSEQNHFWLTAGRIGQKPADQPAQSHRFQQERVVTVGRIDFPVVKSAPYCRVNE
jgi:hypothetical protein